MSGLALPRPSNLRGGPGTHVEGDVYRICERIREIDPNLWIDPLPDGDGFAICERCKDNEDRLVYKAPALDARIIEHLQYLLHVPFERRFAEAERLNEKWEAEQREKELDEMYERMGGPMYSMLERTGFSQRSTSYPKSKRRGRGRL